MIAEIFLIPVLKDNPVIQGGQPLSGPFMLFSGKGHVNYIPIGPDKAENGKFSILAMEVNKRQADSGVRQLLQVIF